jgi:hypothetical protein
MSIEHGIGQMDGSNTIDYPHNEQLGWRLYHTNSKTLQINPNQPNTKAISHNKALSFAKMKMFVL